MDEQETANVNKRECARCRKDLSASGKLAVRFYCRLARVKVTVQEALQELFGKFRGSCQIPPTEKGVEETRCLCQTCASKLSTLYNSWTAFIPSPDDSESYLGQKLKPLHDPIPAPVRIPIRIRSFASTTTQTPPLPPPPETPLMRRIVKARKSKRGSQVLNNVFARFLAAEMKEFVKHTSLCNLIQTLTDIPDWSDLKSELEQYAPSVLAMLNAMGGIRGIDSPLVPSLGTALCIIANTRSKRCNKLQKSIGFVLRQNHTKKMVGHTSH